MAVVREFTLPDLGEGLTEAEIVRWLVQVGDVVAVDQPVVEVETAKAMVEVPCPYGGVVTARFGEEGTELPVGAPLLTVAVGASDVTAPESGAADGAEGDEGSGNVLVGYGTGAPAVRRRRVRPVGGSPRPSGPESGQNGRAAAGSGGAGVGGDRTGGDGVSGAGGSGAGAHRAETGAAGLGGAGVRPAEAGTTAPRSGHAADAARRSESGPPAPVHGHGADGPVAVISPLVRRLAREHGVDLREVRGSGPDGLILRADVEGAARAAVRAAWGGRGEEAPYAAEGTTGPGPGSAPTRPTTVGGPQPGAGPGPVTGPQPGAVTGDQYGPVTGEQYGAESGPVRGRQVGPMPGAERIPLRGVRGVVADKLSRSRREIPDATCWVDADATELMAARAAMNAAGAPKVSLPALLARICTAALARYPELNSTVDTDAREVVRLPAVHLGFAAQTERGLVVPVVRDAHTRNAAALSQEFDRLTEAARAGALTPTDLTGGTFTLNNYGVFGVDGSTPIINHPEAAMLGVGRIAPKPWVHDGALAVRQVVQLSLTFDHRVCDGGTAGGFLRYVADCVEQPAVLLRTL
ncbi:dihydrolipoamide acetyltransferase family protein [Streptomyces sp. 8N706]|uniref:dihydrolipoamide acetyltransferase family protein n=1 Tax=Streptomyces sp. 8N706 TaxID=3457416 RepID=UPI003FD3F9A6